MAQVNLGRVGFVNKGDWEDGLHKINDVVTYDNKVYACILEHTSAGGNILPTNSTYWDVWIDDIYSTKVDTSIIVDVGAGQTYTTINEALEYLSGLYPLYKASGVTATINLKAGFTMAEQVLVRGLDLGWITIVGEDAETIIDHTALTTDFTTTDYGLNSYPAFGVSKGGTSPRIGQLFRFSVEKVGGEKHGIMAVGAGSGADVLGGKGFIGAGTHGIFAYENSTINAKGVIASGAGTVGIHANRSSTINAEGAIASGAGTYGIYAASGSNISAENANASGAGSIGIYAYGGSTINAQGADASNAGSVGIYAISGSTINAHGANASNAGTYGIHAISGSTINAEGANASNVGAYGIFAIRGSNINAEGADASNAGSVGIYADRGSTINALIALIQNQTTGTYCIRVVDGSTIEASAIDTTGSTVTVLSQAANTLTSSGIIYQ